MKPFHFAALLALGATACVDDPSPLQILQAVPPASNCSVSFDANGQGSGSVDVSIAENFYGAEPFILRGYTVGFSIRTNEETPPLLVGDVPLSNPNANAIYLTAMELSYESEPDLNLESVTSPIYTAYEAGDEGGFLTNLFTQENAELLRTATTRQQPVQVIVTLRLKGRTGGGSDFETNEVQYPVTFYRSNPANLCTAYERELEACEIPGQDGFEPECSTVTP